MSNILGALQLLLAVSIFQGLCVAEFPLEDADQTFRSGAPEDAWEEAVFDPVLGLPIPLAAGSGRMVMGSCRFGKKRVVP